MISNRKDADKRPKRPFQARMEDDTKKRYKLVRQRIIGYIHRTYQAGVKPPYQLTPSQRQAWTRLIEVAEQ